MAHDLTTRSARPVPSPQELDLLRVLAPARKSFDPNESTFDGNSVPRRNSCKIAFAHLRSASPRDLSCSAKRRRKEKHRRLRFFSLWKEFGISGK
jgi:hypothetical protein